LKTPRIVIDSDVFVDHLCGKDQPSLLRLAAQKFFCYTTVFQAIELFSFARSEQEFRAIEDSMASVKVLGLNAKNARLYGTLVSKKKNVLRALAAGLCRESKLPLLTGRPGEFKGFGIQVVPVRLVGRYDTGQEILSAVAGTGTAGR
jgi:predicted nucleic acid-binding protein